MLDELRWHPDRQGATFHAAVRRGSDAPLPRSAGARGQQCHLATSYWTCGGAVVSWSDELDPYFAALWSRFETGLAARRILTDRVRLLVSIGVCTVIGESDDVARLSRQALALEVPPAEIQEVMLQACVYAGRPVVKRSLNVFADVVRGSGKLDE